MNFIIFHVVLGLINTCKVSMIGYDMGGAVATGFAAKYPTICASLVLVSPIGVKYHELRNEELLKKNTIGEFLMLKGKHRLVRSQEKEFHDTSLESPHRKMINKQTAMVQWQIDYTPGYLGAVLSAYRSFPLRGMEELYTAVGRHPRPVMIVWGENDRVCPYKKCVRSMESSFPYGCIVDIKKCGHSSILEKFDEIVTELLSFHKEIFTEEVEDFESEI